MRLIIRTSHFSSGKHGLRRQRWAHEPKPFRLLLLVLSMLTMSPRLADAGCGCDHPPPLRGTVYPRFAWSGAPVSVYEPSFATSGASAKISGQEVETYLPADEPDARRMIVPPSVSIGPVAIEVFDREGRVIAEVPESQLTVLPQPLPLYEAQGTFKYEQVTAAVDTDGTLYIPFDLSTVTKPMQFYVTLENLPLRFTEPELVFYNKDQFNLKLFELLVDGPEDYQWGPYYGAKVSRSSDPGITSDVISYWRHEFESYHMAHLPGGSHVAGPDGLHPDGTPHIDHYNLVLGVTGSVSDSSQPDDQSKWRRLQPGVVRTDVVVRQVFATAPVAEANLSGAQRAALIAQQVTVETDPDKGIVKTTNTRTGQTWTPPVHGVATTE